MSTKPKHPVSLRLNDEMLLAINDHREDIALSIWIKDAIAAKLQTEKGSTFIDSRTTPKTTLELLELFNRVSDLESKLANIIKEPKPKSVKKNEQKNIEAPKLGAINGVISHADYRSEIDHFAMELKSNGYTHQDISDLFNKLGWKPAKNDKWTRASVGAIAKRLK